MFVNILQCQVLLSETEAYNCKWAATVNWKGGAGNNIETDLFQENRNCKMKKLISAMGANKTEKAIGSATKASGGVAKIPEAFEKQVKMHQKSAADDEQLISKDLCSIRPFKKKDGRAFELFVDISYFPLQSFNEQKFKEWVERHKNNILKHYTVSDDSDSDEFSE